MKIAQFSDSFLPVVDGVGRVVASYAQTLTEMGHEVTVCAPKTGSKETENLPYTFLPYNAFTVSEKIPYHVGFPRMDAVFDWKIRGMDFDVVHVHSPFMSGHSGLHEARKRGIPIVGSFHSKYYDDFSQALKVDFLARGGVKVVVDFYERCDEVWAVSGSTADTLREYGFKGEIMAMPNGTDFRTLDPAVLPELRARFGLEEGTPVLLYVGQMNWKKNILHTLQACKRLKEKGQPFRLVLAGQGPHQHEIAEEIKALGIADRAVMAGHIADTRMLDGLYSLASLFVFPSLYDNAPMVLREASVMRTPSVLVAGSTAAESIKDQINGFTCEDTPESIAGVIERALADLDALRQVGEKARETIPVPWPQLMEQVAGRYSRLMELRRR